MTLALNRIKSTTARLFVRRAWRGGNRDRASRRRRGPAVPNVVADGPAAVVAQGPPRVGHSRRFHVETFDSPCEPARAAAMPPCIHDRSRRPAVPQRRRARGRGLLHRARPWRTAMASRSMVAGRGPARMRSASRLWSCSAPHGRGRGPASGLSSVHDPCTTGAAR